MGLLVSSPYALQWELTLHNGSNLPRRTKGLLEVPLLFHPPAALMSGSAKLEQDTPLEPSLHLKAKTFEEVSDTGKSDGGREELG